MKRIGILLVSAVLMAGGSVLAPAQAGAYQGWGYQDRDWRDSDAYRDGLRQGRWDAEHNRRADSGADRWRYDFDRRAYQAGYSEGYRQASYHPPYGYRGVDSIRQIGFQDGWNDGLRDRQTGHSFRPTHDNNFKNADRGYNSGFGSRNEYKQIYRGGYESGYEKGYDGRRGY